MRYAFAEPLARHGRGSVRALARVFGDTNQLDGVLVSLRTAIEQHVPRNCYEERYDRWLVQCLAGDCPGGESVDRPLGGEYTLY